MKLNRTLPFLLLALLLIAACATSGATTTTGAGPTTTTRSGATTTAAANGAAVSIATTPLGEVLVDGAGHTLYILTADAQGTPTCVDSCASNWPALTGTVSAGEGVDAGKLGTTARADGTEQATYNNWPLYRFSGDSAPGDTNGQGINDVWWVIGPAGEPISSSSSGSGYN